MHTWRISTQAERTADELALLLSGLLANADIAFESQVTGLVVASVVPDVTAAMREMASRYLPVPSVIVGPGTKKGAPILTDNPREVGADRVVNALAAFDRFGGRRSSWTLGRRRISMWSRTRGSSSAALSCSAQASAASRSPAPPASRASS